MNRKSAVCLLPVSCLFTFNEFPYIYWVNFHFSGKVKEKSFDSLAGTTALRSQWISQNSATQRKGRAGRTAPGSVYRLYSKARYDSFSMNATPEILRYKNHHSRELSWNFFSWSQSTSYFLPHFYIEPHCWNYVYKPNF